MFKRDFISNIISVLAVTIYSMSITEILTTIVLATAATLNIINIIYKLKNKDKHKIDN